MHQKVYHMYIFTDILLLEPGLRLSSKEDKMNRATIRTQIRNKLQDFVLYDKNNGVINSSATSITVQTPSKFFPNGTIMIDSEMMRVLTVDTTTYTITVMRAYRDTTAASHNTLSTIYIFDMFTNSEINDAIDECFNAIFPKLYQIIQDTSLTSSSEFSYDVSGFDPAVLDRYGIHKLEIKSSTEDAWAEVPSWYYNANDSKIYIESIIPSGCSLRVSYIAKYNAPTDDTTEKWELPSEYSELVKHYVIGRLQEASLNLRVKFFEYSAAANPDAASVGDIMGVAGYSLYQFTKLLDSFAMPLPSFFPNRRQKCGAVIAFLDD